ncbi:hypothetical protein [uncultured Methanobrevibacter sp.]|uniref:hypothetical protein n=1 Tax=uncultured Methanobrevibacter sp. TaxID=253161 RepID=UPI00262FF7CA|nr:hypothetical protein [uncultured Methanobrevibacter sp.]
MVRFIKTFIYHHSIDLLTDKERKINVIFQIIIVTFFYFFLSVMMTFRQNYEYFIPIFIIGISFWIPEWIFKIFLKKIDKYYNVYDKIRPDKFSFDGYALENLIRGISVSSSFLIFFIAIKATLPGFCVAFSMIYTVIFIFLRRKKYWKMFEPKFEEDPDPIKLRKFINIFSGEGGVICGMMSVGSSFYLINEYIMGISHTPIIYLVILTIIAFILFTMTLYIDFWNKILPWDLTEFKNYWNYCTVANGICLGFTFLIF